METSFQTILNIFTKQIFFEKKKFSKIFKKQPKISSNFFGVREKVVYLDLIDISVPKTSLYHLQKLRYNFFPVFAPCVGTKNGRGPIWGLSPRSWEVNFFLVILDPLNSNLVKEFNSSFPVPGQTHISQDYQLTCSKSGGASPVLATLVWACSPLWACQPTDIYVYIYMSVATLNRE